MGLRRALEILGIADRLSDEGSLHDERVEQEVAGQHAKGEDDYCRVGRHLAGRGRGEVVQVHRCGHEPVEESHEDSGGHGQEYAFPGVGVLTAPADLGRRDAVAHHRDHYQRDSEEEPERVSLRGAYVVDHGSEHQREPDSERERDGQAGDRGGGREQYVGSVEDHAAQQNAADVLEVGLGDVLGEMPALAAETSHREGYQQGECQHSYHIVPVEKLISPGLGREFLGVAP